MSQTNQTAESPEQYKIVLQPTRGWFLLNLRDVWNYRFLAFIFVRRDFVAQYKQTILGPLWFFIQPVLVTSVFTVIFGQFAGLPSDGVPSFLFYMAGNVCWAYFSDCMIKTSATFAGNAGLFSKVYFPRLVIPISTVMTNVLKLGIQLMLFLCFYVYFWADGAQINVNAWLLFLPVVFVQMAIFGLGAGIIISSLTVKYRDLAYLVEFGAQLLMYATPVIYPLSMISDEHRWLFMLNPMASVIEVFRFAFFSVGQMDLITLLVGWLITLLTLLVGVLLFNRTEQNFIDTV